jgi:GTP-binding protein HflX
MSTPENDPIDRILARAASAANKPTVSVFSSGKAQAIDDDSQSFDESGFDGDQFDRDERSSLRRVNGLSTELEDVTEVEYRQVRLENVILIGVYPKGHIEDGENSLRELAAL